MMGPVGPFDPYGLLGGPFSPRPIIDPSGTVDCGDNVCQPSLHEPNPCQDFPLRICRKWPSLCDDRRICMHKALFPILPEDLGSFAAIFAVAFLAGAPGIGGGGINVPVLMLLARFDIKEAVPLSHVAVLGNTLAQLMVNLRRAHPHCGSRPLIHFEAAGLILPAMLGGNCLGVVIGHVFPPTLLIVVSLVLLAGTSLKTVSKGLHLRRRALVAAAEATATQPLAAAVAAGQSSEVKVRYPRKVVCFLCSFLLLFCMDYLLLSTDVSGIRSCTFAYWGALLGIYPFVGLAVLFGARRLRDLADWHRSQGHGVVPEDLQAGPKSILMLPAAASLIGLLAGLLGLGGGELIVPLLLEFGVQARVAAATSGFLTFLGTLSNVVHYCIAGTMEPFLGHGTAYFLVAMMGSLAGLRLGNVPYVQERSYLIVFLVALLLAASGLLLGLRGLTPDRISWAFQPFCGR